MSASQFLAMLAPTTIIGIIVFLIAQDKWTKRRLDEKIPHSCPEAKPSSAKQRALATLARLDDNADMEQILVALRQERDDRHS